MTETRILEKLSDVLARDDAAAGAADLLAMVDRLPDAAIGVMDDALATADPLMQVAIMDAYFEMTGDRYHESDLEDLMRAAARRGDAGEELYMAARVALGRLNGLSMDSMDDWGDGDLVVAATARTMRSKSLRRGPKVVDTITIIIHGTWAANGTWWRPKGDFFEYVKQDLGRADVYGKPDQFKWSGKNRDRKRKKASSELHKWMKAHPAAEVNVFGHSHGANVAMLATRKGVRIDRLIMLSPPVRKDYFAKWANVGAAYNIQANRDPVVALARGGQWFRIPQVKEKKMRTNGHSSSHESAVWKKEKLAGFVGIPW